MKNEKETILKDEKLMHEFKTMLTQEDIVKNMIEKYLIHGYPNEDQIKKIHQEANEIIEYIRKNQDDLIWHVYDETLG